MNEPTLILRADAGMIRDAFIQADKQREKQDGPILVLRQIKCDDSGNPTESKMMRLTKREADALAEFWGKNRGESDASN